MEASLVRLSMLVVSKIGLRRSGKTGEPWALPLSHLSLLLLLLLFATAEEGRPATMMTEARVIYVNELQAVALPFYRPRPFTEAPVNPNAI